LLPGGVFDPVFHFWWSLKISMKLTDIRILIIHSLRLRESF